MNKPLTEEELLPFSALPPRLLETERLQLRAIERTDAKLIFDLYASDPIATKYMSFKCTGQFKDTEDFVIAAALRFNGQSSSTTHFAWVIELKTNGLAIGSAGLEICSKFCISGGYILGQKFWGQGYATEAWKCLVDWAKTQPQVMRIEAIHHVANSASGKVLLKAGLSFEGVMKSYTISPNVSDKPQDAAMYAWGRSF